VLFPLLQSHHFHPQAGIVAHVAMVSLSSSMCRHPCSHHIGVVALVAMPFLPLMRRHLAVIAMAIATLVAMVSLLYSS
jgi:hypothetical protein